MREGEFKSVKGKRPTWKWVAGKRKEEKIHNPEEGKRDGDKDGNKTPSKSRGCLVSSDKTEGEWCVKGDVPRPVVMLLQLLHYAQEKQDLEDEPLSPRAAGPMRKKSSRKGCSPKASLMESSDQTVATTSI
jgi:hypothetical protein